MPKVAYTGHRHVTYMDYIDEVTGKTLIVEPGGVYHVRTVGSNVPDVPPLDFMLAEPENEEELTASAPEVEE